ncbi:MAG: hypothetical protein K2H74_00495 [Paramuribaculum sp.]|nr:hypothetical protein [Paramuribaculum sp.]
MIAKHKIFWIALLMIAGAIVYILFRVPVIFTMPFQNIADQLPLISLPDNTLTYALRFIIPDVLWCVALLIYASVLQSSILRYIALAMPVGMELGQYFGFIPGTFDIADLTAYLLITFIFILKWKKSKSISLQFSAA